MTLSGPTSRQKFVSAARWFGSASLSMLLLVTLPWSSQAAALGLCSAQCARLPIVGDDFAAAYEYYLPSDGGYWDHAIAIVPIFRPSGYWCTEKEAKFGYHHAIFPDS